jgi:hypothetical protein
MKNYNIILSVCLLLQLLFMLTNAHAQVPQGIPYQAVARNAAGEPLANKPVKVRFSILDSTITGNAVYVETHSTTTSALGLFVTNVGMGTPTSGTFNTINWGQNFKFLKVELDTTASGNNYVNLGTQQMMSVPYALIAGSIQANSNPNSPAQLKYFKSHILTDTTILSIPIGESWKIVSINISPQWGPVSVSIPFFEPGINYCRYAFTPSQTYLLLNINGMQYSTGYPYTYPSSGTFYQISQNCGGTTCTNCPPSQSISFTPSASSLSTINLPVWVNAGGVIQIAQGVIVSIEIYH